MQLTPYIRFNDRKCREAMAFYKKCFGGKLELMTIGDSPMAEKFPKADHDKIMHAMLLSKQVTLSGSDMMRDKAVVGDNVAISVDCDSAKQEKELFKMLSDGGEVFMPLELQFWGGVFGVVTDKYGVEWMLNYQKTPMKK